MREATIELVGISKMDRRELGESGVTYIEHAAGKGRYGEPATLTAMIAISAIHVFAAYLLRKHARQEFNEEVRIVRPDGSVEIRIVRYRIAASQAPEAEIIKQIGQI